MCGIIGIIDLKGRNIWDLAVNNLRNLEYRGYDSFGFAYIINNQLKFVKKVGSISNARLPNVNTWAVIGHTRWATHGKVNEINAHPHSDCKKEIAVVHNGIIENYLELKRELKNHKFISETDSEVIAHLWEKYRDINKVMKKLKGTWAVLILDKNGNLYAFKKDSPLLFTIKNNMLIFSSDPIVLGKEFYVIDDYGYVIFENNKIRFSKIKKYKLNFKLENSKNIGYFMINEIKEGPKHVKRILKRDINSLINFIDSHNEIAIVGSGSSYHAALYGSYILRKLGYKANAYIASEFDSWEDGIIAISQSGETMDLIKALKGKEFYLITNYKGNTLDRLSKNSFYMNVGFERGVAATKTYLGELATFLKLYIEKTNEKIDLEFWMNYWGNKTKNLFITYHSAYFLSKGINLVTAMEGALKLKEISYIHAEAYPAGESKHGPIALVEKDFPCIFITPPNLKSNIEEMKSRGAKIILIGNEDLGSDYFIKIPKVNEIASPIINIIPLQFLAYYNSLKRGLNPDKPRNLAKSVTVI